MANLAQALKEEVTRLARKEIRATLGPLKKSNAQYRRDIASLKRRIGDLERETNHLRKQVGKQAGSQAGRGPAARTSGANGIMGSDGPPRRFSPSGLKKHRDRLGISAADFGALVGVTGQSIYNWETGNARPRAAQLEAIANVRAMGKREAIRALEELE